jgi:hypothetical protein
MYALLVCAGFIHGVVVLNDIPGLNKSATGPLRHVSHAISALPGGSPVHSLLQGVVWVGVNDLLPEALVVLVLLVVDLDDDRLGRAVATRHDAPLFVAREHVILSLFSVFAASRMGHVLVGCTVASGVANWCVHGVGSRRARVGGTIFIIALFTLGKSLLG